jgi:hypothetical protein
MGKGNLSPIEGRFGYGFLGLAFNDIDFEALCGKSSGETQSRRPSPDDQYTPRISAIHAMISSFWGEFRVLRPRAPGALIISRFVCGALRTSISQDNMHFQYQLYNGRHDDSRMPNLRIKQAPATPEGANV